MLAANVAATMNDIFMVPSNILLTMLDPARRHSVGLAAFYAFGAITTASQCDAVVLCVEFTAEYQPYRAWVGLPRSRIGRSADTITRESEDNKVFDWVALFTVCEPPQCGEAESMTFAQGNRPRERHLP
jgi:hypothetical protein